MNARSALAARLGRRADLPTYLGGWVATMSWVYVVGTTIGITAPAVAMAAIITGGYVLSFVLRGCTERSWWPWVEKLAVPLLNVARLLFVVLIAPAALGHGPLAGLIPDLARGQEEWVIGSVFVWAMALHSLTMFSDGPVAFSSVLGVAMMGLMGTDNVNPEVGVAFLPFLLGNVLMLSNMGLTHYIAGRAGPTRRANGPNGEQLARWLGDQFIVSGLTVAVTAVVGILMGALLQTVMPRLMLPGVRMPPGLTRGAKATGGFTSLGEQMVVGTGGGLPPETPVMLIQCAEPLLWRRRVYDDFTGRMWRKVREESRRLGQRLDGSTVVIGSNEAESLTWRRRRAVPQNITALANTELAAAPLVTWLGLSTSSPQGPPVLLPDGDVRAALIMGQQATVLSQVPDPTEDELRAAPWEDQADNPWTLIVPVSARAAIEPLAKRLAAGRDGPYAVARAIQDHLEQTITYDAVIHAPESQASVMAWFLTEKRGACDLIASAMVLLARANGIPARVASGYATGKRQPDGRYLVTVAQAHAWAELHFEGLGWIPFNPAVQGQSEYAGNAELRARLARLLRLRWPAALMLAMLAWLAVYVVGEWRRSRPRFGATPVGRVAQAYHRAQIALARAGRQRLRHETPREHLERLAITDPDAEYLTDLTRVAEGYERVRYGLGELDDLQVQAIELSARHLPQSLRRVRRHRDQRRRVR